MSFINFSRQSTNDHSDWARQAEQTIYANNTGNNVFLSANHPQDIPQTGEQIESMRTHSQANKALDKRRSLEVNLDPALCQHLQEDSSVEAPCRQQQKHMSTSTANNDDFSTNDTEIRMKGTKSQANNLKSSIRQVSSAPTSPHQKPINQKRGGGKSVKFNPFHLEKVCVFQGTQSPSEVPRSDEIKCAPFKVVYSQWPPIQHTLFQHQQNVQLKRSLKIRDGGSTLRGQVLVRNLGYEKQVEIRYTLDGWQTVNNVMAEYQHSHGTLDTFAYDIHIEQGMADRGNLRATVDLAVRYTVAIINNGMGDYSSKSISSSSTDNNHHSHLYKHGTKETFWDNNDGHNYQLQVVETSGTKSTYNKALTTSSSLTVPDPGSDSFDDTRGTHYLDTDLHLSTSSIASSSNSRYDFGQSIIKAKHMAKPSSSSSGHQVTPQRETQSTPSSPGTDAFYASGTQSLTSSSYSDLVKKYCFYGSQDTSSPSTALSING
ncbi:putative phosphatase regulatory subunit-domain-containing protein [Absidia repens]|uniref:Putative phosphatase regulatory subunit-domain-containing protein n=1 Tax=Absidia repens TaxID=90262 RepID=A0A1X2I331_9FUNG|nr:putative phosphatase regulatory subunit-domain-containing protein [Absidia repens]